MSAIVVQALRQWRDCRDAFEDYREAAYAAAEAATNGVLLNKRGRRNGIDPWSLFIGSDIRAYAYASDELRAHWVDKPRMSFAAFEQQWSDWGVQ